MRLPLIEIRAPTGITSIGPNTDRRTPTCHCRESMCVQPVCLPESIQRRATGSRLFSFGDCDRFGDLYVGRRVGSDRSHSSVSIRNRVIPATCRYGHLLALSKPLS